MINRSDNSEQELDQIAERFVQALRAGEQPCIEEYIGIYGDCSGELRELLESVSMIEGAKRAAGNESSAAIGAAFLKPLETVDDYKILRELGRGGMGIVYEAVHQSLDRRVAIKILAPGLLSDEKNLARFRTEARAAARLRHPNIVSVFGTGKSDLYHYYVMDLIEGESLRDYLGHLSAGHSRTETSAAAGGLHSQTDSRKEISGTAVNLDFFRSSKHRVGSGVIEVQTGESDPRIADPVDAADASLCPTSPKYSDWVALIGEKVCDALQYAHSQGVLHRDIKPGNLLIDNHGEVWVADFGLAKLGEQQDLTKTGEVLGTTQYLAPETFRGEYTSQSEVYAVGLTLFELLTLRPAIGGRNSAETLRHAMQGVSMRPSQIDSRVSKDFETVLMKALALEPCHRYQSIGELRDELRRLRQGVPIAARATGTWERLWRWTRREPVLASFGATTLVLITLLATVSSIGYFQTSSALRKEKSAVLKAESATRRANQALRSKTEAFAAADAQRTRAEANLQTALSAFDQIMEDIVQRGPELDSEFLGEVEEETVANVSPADAQLLRKLLVFFDELAKNNSSELLYESAKAAHAAGDIYVSLGQLAESQVPYLAAKQRYARLLELYPDNPSYPLALADLLNDLLALHQVSGQFVRAERQFQELLEVAEKTLPEENAMMQYQLARGKRLVATLTQRPGNVQREFPSSGRPIFIHQRLQRNRETMREAIGILQSLLESAQANATFEAELARAYRGLAHLDWMLTEPEAAEAELQQSISIWRKLLEDHPKAANLKFELATTLVDSSTQGKVQRNRIEQAVGLAEELLDETPDLPQNQALLAIAKEQLARLEFEEGNANRAEMLYWQAIRNYSDLIVSAPHVRAYRFRRAGALEAIANLKIENEEIEAAVALLERALQRLQPRPGIRREASLLEQRLAERLGEQLKRLKDQQALEQKSDNP